MSKNITERMHLDFIISLCPKTVYSQNGDKPKRRQKFIVIIVIGNIKHKCKWPTAKT